MTSANAIQSDPRSGLGIKQAVRAATTGSDIFLIGLQTIDGVVLVAGDRVLVKDQVDATQNGIYTAQSNRWPRDVDTEGNNQWGDGTQVLVTSGTINAATAFVCTAADPIVLDTSALTFAASLIPNVSIEYALTGGGAPIGAGLNGQFLEVPFHCTVLGWSLVADQVGSLVVDVWRTTFANLGSMSAANSITGTEQPTLTAAQTAQASTLAGWTKALNARDWLGYSVSPGASVNRATLSLYCARP